MKYEWQSRPLASLCDGPRSICYGIVQPGHSVPEGVPLLRVNNFGSSGLDLRDVKRVSSDIEAGYSRSRLRGGELLITLVGSMGMTAIAPDSLAGWNVARAVGVVPIPDSLDARWARLVLQSADAQAYIRARANTTVQATFNLGDLASFEVPYPDEGTRRGIVDAIGSLDDKIDLNRRTTTTLEDMVRALFRSWFVDFDPVRANMEGREIGLPPDIAHLFPNHVGDDGLPAGWSWAPLRAVVENIVDRCAPGDETSRRPYVPIDCITSRSTVLRDFRPGNEAASSLVRFQEGDILFGAMRPYFHKVALAPWAGTTRTTVWVLRAPSAEKHFALFLLDQSSTIDFATAHSTGSTIPYAVWQGSMSDMPVPLPPASLRRNFGEVVSPLLAKAAAAESQSLTLAKLRELLMPKLISGELRIPDVEALVEEAA